MSNETPPGTVAVRNPKDLLSYLQRSKSAIEMALPKHLNADRMCRLALTCFSTTPALRQCTPQSILASVVVASQLGLEPGIAGQGYLIPYKGQCTFVPGWQGLVSLLNNTGRATAWTGAVYEGDEWTFQLGSRPRCEHVPGPNYGDPELLRWVYACGRVNGSEQPVIEAWPMARVWKHRDKYNKVGQRHYSYANEEMYARKVVLLQVLKYMPRSIELNNAITAADAAELGLTTKVEDSVVIIEGEPADIPQEKPVFEAPKAALDKVFVAADKAGVYDNSERQTLRHDPVTPPEPEPMPEPEPTPAEKPRGARKAPAVNLPPSAKERLIEANVSFADFTGWLVTTGREKNANEWLKQAERQMESGGTVPTPAGLYSFVPEAYWKTLETDAIGIGRAITLYGKNAV